MWECFSFMIKGIKKQMIEVNNIDHPYYERAFLIVKPEYSYFKERILKREAKEVINGFTIPRFKEKRCNILKKVIKMGIAAGIGAGLTALAMM